MALAKECDACGDFYKPSPNEEEVNGIAFVYFDAQSQIQNTIEKKELCPKCIDNVRKALAKK